MERPAHALTCRGALPASGIAAGDDNVGPVVGGTSGVGTLSAAPGPGIQSQAVHTAKHT
jgi:hypothetical protein